MQNYNLVHSVKDITEQSGDPTEPVTVSEVKSYMRLEGFQDVTQSEATSFVEDDTLIETLIVAARKRLEKLYGISIIPKTLRATFTNLAGDIEIPQGPVISITSLKDRYDNLIVSDNYTVVGDDFQTLESPCYEKMVMTYEAGYTDCPEELKIEIMRMVTYWFENRGDKELKGFVFQTWDFNRNTFIA
jgi:hypothetical protein